MSAHTCDHGVWIGYKCCRCGGRALRKTRPTFTPPPCSAPGGHVWVCRDDDEEVSYCEHSGSDGNA